MYPSHEAQTRPQSPSTVDTPPGLHQHGGVTVDSVCAALKISRGTYDMLMDSYFTNMTAFSLFRPGSIEPKFAVMQNHSDAEALIAAIFSVSARHCRDAAVDQASDCPSPSYFAHIASTQLDESVDRYGDSGPPFWLLQAGILVTFYQLTLSVRSRSWKKLGDCIRFSYDLNLHIVDANHEPTSSTERSDLDLHRWALLEERRRAWWAVWEMDVFASTIRRLPTAIDQSLNLTLLPVADSCWFNNIYQESCFLVEDCSLRWKHLAQSGNRSAKSWFIVMNSLMRNTQRIVYPAGSAIKTFNEKAAETNQNELDIMANCLYCTVASLPLSLLYQGETLDFRPRSSPQEVNPRQEHADKYAIHLMTQLCRFMIYHHKICARAPWLMAKGPPDQEAESSAQANSEWSNYMSASDEIVLVVRNSSTDHYKYVNPFLANTLWFAAAAQCACKVFGPPSFNKRLTASNLDLLKLTIDRFISFWNGTENLREKLARIEAGLKNLMASADGNGAAGSSARRERQPARSGLEDVSKMPAAVQNPSDSEASVQFSMQPESLLLGVASNGWADPSSSAFVPDFTQAFSVAGQNFFSGDPMDVSPFGLEELLMNNMVHHM
ncbi:hypothetical protein CONLIGDRAFT_656283 [Coniochaeta ligniaria NRRL 30616]|uniref:Xylanolytic transcriptional activator regulatory domain-containing protein n=1 Tax=Coniochaeta ligniaria NRRL 30616 TaxID=1408157 RepID=A0A1J7II73_9PEZI|nr:hypothetical protein CONLIGDRAFT_656283 [Coniochaeta ligniaria NRRL 30616]